MKTYHTKRRIQFYERSIAAALSEIADVLATHDEEDCLTINIDREDGPRTYSGEPVARSFHVEVFLQKEERRQG